MKRKGSEFVTNKPNITFFCLFFCFWLKYNSSIHNIDFSSQTVGTVWEKYADMQQICWRILMWEVNRGWTFSLEKALLLTILARSRNRFLQTCSFSIHKTVIDGLEWRGLLVDYCDVFISCLDSHSDGTHSLQSELFFPNLFWWRNKFIYVFNVLRESTFSANFPFWVNPQWNLLGHVQIGYAFV